MSIRNLCSEIETELNNAKEVLSFVDRRRRRLPPGSLVIRKRKLGKYYVQAVKVDGSSREIALDPDKDEDLLIIKELKEKKVAVHSAPILRSNIKHLEKCLTALQEYKPFESEYATLLPSGYFPSDEVCISDWLKAPDCQNPNYPEHLIHETKKGPLVRSKSEVLISNTLFDYGIPYLNEPELVLGGRIFYPDFKILNVKTNRPLLWEHLGLIHNLDYMLKNLKKIDWYALHGIRLYDNLIITWEDSEHPLIASTIIEKLKFHSMID